MKKNLFFLIPFCFSFYVMAENVITLRNEAEYCVITPNEISLLYYALGEGEREIICKNEIQFDCSIPYIYSTKQNKRIMFLNNGYIVRAMLSSDKSVFFEDFLGFFSKKDNCYLFPIGFPECSATSELTEKGYTYSVKNLRSSKISTPWVEGVKGPGIGEKITIKHTREQLPPWQKDYSGGALVIFNGFISYEKPYLYEYNNRVKDLKIYTSNNEYNFMITLDDTPNPQIIFLPCVSDDTILEILSVYKGSRYDDTCIETIASFPAHQADILYKIMHNKGDKILGFISEL